MPSSSPNVQSQPTTALHQLPYQQNHRQTYNTRYRSRPNGRRHASRDFAPPTNVQDPHHFPALGVQRASIPPPAPMSHQPQAYFERWPDRSSQGRGQGGQMLHGSYTPAGHFNQHLPQTNQYPAQHQQPAMRHYPDRRPHQNQTYHAAAPPTAFPQGTSNHHQIRRQNDYLNDLNAEISKSLLSTDEMQKKEALRKRLEAIAQTIFALSDGDGSVDAGRVRLKCYGSSRNGFALPGADLDLVLVLPGTKPAEDTIIERGRLLEKSLLDDGFGARLLINTRVPILKVCDSPSETLLVNLRRKREQWEAEEANRPSENLVEESVILQQPTYRQLVSAENLFEELSDLAINTPLPNSESREVLDVEFTKDSGIHCDINFSNQVAVYNSELLRIYSEFDPRVRNLGIFVKTWAKRRKINTPYHGTLSSYGYIMMVLHYLMNVANPPIIPNLQLLARSQDDWASKTDIELFDGFDIRFLQSRQELEDAKNQMTQNRETLGSLIAGFFSYYGQNNGFHWTGEVISLRTKGGILKKQDKGWTGAKWAENSNHIRLRYLLCIEDPFEVEHNIARTVVHSGIVAIRDEFRRAIRLLTSIAKTDNKWQWHASEALSSESLIEEIPDREDFLRKDTEAHRARAKQRKLNDQAENASSLQSNSTWGDASQADRDGTWNESCSASSERQDCDSLHEASYTQLTRDVTSQQVKRRHFGGRLRKVKDESEDESEAEGPSVPVSEEPQVDPTVESDVPNVTVAIAEQLSQELLDRHEEANNYSTQGLNAIPVPEPWDLNTKAGRWLERRDNKMRNDQEVQIRNSEQRKWNDQFPHDPRRPATDPLFGLWVAQEIYPPWPSTAPTVDETTMQNSQTGPSGNAEQSDGPVGPSKATETTWDRRTQGGSWLFRRDRQIEAGTFIPPRWQHHLVFHKAFPYNPKRTPDELQLMNELLRQYCRQRNWLLDDSDVRVQKALAEFYSSKEGNLGKAFTSGHRDKGQYQSPTVNDASSEAAVVSETLLPSEIDPILNVQSLMRDAGMSFTDDKHLRADSGISGLSGKSQPRVPTTLHPLDTEASPQPREENPQIIPIPRRLHHQFDVRQLRDMDTIRRGGNGCVRRSTDPSHVRMNDSTARFLEAWEIGMIEESSECEWGGGGAMGEQVWGGSTSKDDATRSATEEVLEMARIVDMQSQSSLEHVYHTGNEDLGDDYPFNAEDGVGNEIFWANQENTAPTSFINNTYQHHTTSGLPPPPTMTDTTSERPPSSLSSDPAPLPAIVPQQEPFKTEEEGLGWDTNIWTGEKVKAVSWNLHSRAADVEGEDW